MTREFFLAEAGRALATHPRKDALLVELEMWLGAEDTAPSGTAILPPRQVFSEVSRAILAANPASAVAVLGGLAARVRPWVVLAETTAWTRTRAAPDAELRKVADAASWTDDRSVGVPPPSPAPPRSLRSLVDRDAEALVSRVVEERARLLESSKVVAQPVFTGGQLHVHDPASRSAPPLADHWLEWKRSPTRYLLCWIPHPLVAADERANAFEYAAVLPDWVRLFGRAT